MELKRSWMFVPGHRQKMIDKALGLNADAIMLDIEDGVAPNEKDTARKNIAESLGREKTGGTPVRYVRINAIGHPRMDADPAHRWLRGCVRDACAATPAERQVSRGRSAAG